MSKTKKKLYAKKYQPWYQKKVKLATEMEELLLKEKKVERPRRVPINILLDSVSISEEL